ncbi:MAG: N-glycosylase/DNA lyase [Candidatus Bathyarchaeota archaeon]|nr:N-glycosylase/DNA lyase [Candidatus Bathyarchaeota archaeon]
MKCLIESDVGKKVRLRMEEFRRLGRLGSDKDLFSELCFCILTAKSNAERCIRIQEEIGGGFLTLPEDILAKELKRLGHRYPYVRARYIVEARQHLHKLRWLIDSFSSGVEARYWLIENVKGFGYKEASHFLRNVGFEDVAIIDFHILNLLTRYGIVEKPKTLTPRRYREIESILRFIASKLNISLGELDLYLWYMETGKILK